MTTLLERAGAAFLRAFGTSFLFYSTGILASPNLEGAVALALSAGAASIAAGLRAIQVFVPAISFRSIIGDRYGALVDSFARAGIGNFVAGAAAWFSAPDLSTWRVAWTAVLIGAATAGARALQGTTTHGEWPAPAKGLKPKT